MRAGFQLTGDEDSHKSDDVGKCSPQCSEGVDTMRIPKWNLTSTTESVHWHSTASDSLHAVTTPLDNAEIYRITETQISSSPGSLLDEIVSDSMQRHYRALIEGLSELFFLQARLNAIK